jgi:hypothetical protein
VSPVFAVSQSPAFEFPIYTAGNAVAISPFNDQDRSVHDFALLFP